MGPEGRPEPLARAVAEPVPLGGDAPGGGLGAWQRRRIAQVEDAFELVRVIAVLLWIVAAVLAAHAVTDGRPDLHPWAVLGLLAALAVHGVGRAWAAESLRDVAVAAGTDGELAAASGEREVARLERQRVDTLGARTTRSAR